MSILTLFQGCEESDFNPFKAKKKYINLTLTKTKDATLFSFDRLPPADDEGNYYPGTYSPKDEYNSNLYHTFSSIFRDDYVLDENNKKIYIPRLAFHFETSHSTSLPYGVRDVYLIPCDSKKDYEYVDHVNYTGYNNTDELRGLPQSEFKGDYRDKNHDVYFRIDQMREYGLVLNDRTKQKDLCILAKWCDGESIGKFTGYYACYTSNRLRFTAEEISSVVQEYDEAGFSQYDGQY